MSRTLRAVMILFLVASCGMGGRSGSPPGNLDNACAILAERPQYKRAFRATERRWGIPVHVQMATIHQESKFDGNARTPFRYVLGVIPMGRQSSAYGYSQALDGTWDEYKRDTRRFSARRNDIDDATDFMGWYMAKSYERLGIPLHDARNQYLAYHEGRTGFSRGSYNAKPWLLRVSANVEERSRLYQAQLMSCNGRGYGVF
ncbi:lytic transglycosylase [Roseovarius sp. PS-C2]|uniref:transglycosylase SLT domain-containing protein n=1 Tax=Roseovarius sp. PS-C2 TaxID=2820814 RepID=UPI001C0D0977|nr:lytic transglycosylase [Roseovarius sp. PS-C2]MBU3260176.1 lytic transglycosylase [Roseovarius sp. PS-C2]